MKGDIVEPSTELLAYGFAVLAALALLFVIKCLHVLISSVFTSEVDRFRVHRLLSNDSIIVEEAGESSTEYLFTLNISTLTEFFDLNLIYDKLQGTNCRLYSTADSANPSFRKLGLAVPKKSESSLGFGSSLFVLVFIGCGSAIIVSQVPVLYNYFPNAEFLIPMRFYDLFF